MDYQKIKLTMDYQNWNKDGLSKLNLRWIIKIEIKMDY